MASLLLPPSDIPSSFGLGHVVFLLLLSKHEEHVGKSELCCPGGGLGLSCPLATPWAFGSGVAQWTRQVRSGQQGLIPKSGFVESGRAPALSKQTPAGPHAVRQEWAYLSRVCVWGQGWGGFRFLCAYRNHFRTWVTVASGKKYDFGGGACDPRYFHGGFPNNTSNN